MINVYLSVAFRHRLTALFLSRIPLFYLQHKKNKNAVGGSYVKSTGLWIADPDDAYGKAFMEYVNLKESHLFQVRICTDREALRRDGNTADSGRVV